MSVEREALREYGQHLQHCDSWEDVESLDILGNLNVVPAWWDEPVNVTAWLDDPSGGKQLGQQQAAALLAQTPPGEGVYIASGGTLMRAYAVNAYDPDRDDPDDYDRNVYRLVPIEGADRD